MTTASNARSRSAGRRLKSPLAVDGDYAPPSRGNPRTQKLQCLKD